MEHTAVGPVPAQPFQFTIRSLLWLTAAAAMVLAFVRPADWHHHETALIGLGIGAPFAGVLGWATGRIFDVLYWTLLTFALAILCLAGQANATSDQVMAWSALAIVNGAMAGAYRPGQWAIKLTGSAAGGTIGMLMILGWNFDLEDFSDLGLALIVSCAVSVLSELFYWARVRYRTSYGAWAASLVLAVILGNWGAEWVTALLLG